MDFNFTQQQKLKYIDIAQKKGWYQSLIEFQIYVYRRHLAAYRIQQEWFRAKYDYNNPIGKRFIEKGYDECFNQEKKLVY